MKVVCLSQFHVSETTNLLTCAEDQSVLNVTINSLSITTNCTVNTVDCLGRQPFLHDLTDLLDPHGVVGWCDGAG